VALSERQIKLIEAMRINHGWITTTEAAKVLTMVSKDTILRDLHDLIRKGVVKKKGRTKAARYVLVNG
jgi:predicted HTH transcriptional regulator